MTKVVPNLICIQDLVDEITYLNVRIQLGRQIWIIFLVLTSLSTALGQVEDDFSTQVLNSEWQGDRSQFVVTEEGRLQLDATEEGPSYLSTPIKVDSNFQWEISAAMSFDPSASNKLDIALIADNEDLTIAEGLFVRIGESGSDDAVSLYTREFGALEILGRGQMGEVADNPIVSLQIKLDEGLISVRYDLTGGRNYQLAFEVLYEKELPIEGHFGVMATYTSTRADDFLFDDVYAGPIRFDRESPEITGSIFTNNLVCVNFSESIDPSSIELQQSVLLSPEVSGANLILQGNVLKIEGDFELDTSYEIDLIDIRDFANNGLDTTITVIQVSPLLPGELLINEVLFNPRGDGADYIELYNNGTRELSLDGLQLSNTVNSNQVTAANGIRVVPGGYIVLTPFPENIVDEYPTHEASNIMMSSIPRISNDNGNVTLAIGGVEIDALDYKEDMHLIPLDEVDGVSLERISFLSDTQDPTNWTSASGSIGYGSPGLPNSASEADVSSKLEFEKRQKVVSSSGRGLADELVIDYKLDKSGYVGTVEVFDEYGNTQGFIFQNQSLAVNGEINWDVTCRDGANCNIGIYILSIRLFHPQGDTWEERVTVGVSE